MPIDRALGLEIEAALRTIPTLSIVPEVELRGRLAAIAKQYVKDPESIWWWECLKAPSRTISYGEDDGLKILEQLVPDQSDIVTLVATDDQPQPWVGIEGDIRSLCKLIGECRFFEYIVFPESCEWVIFDTHHNQLVATGSVV